MDFSPTPNISSNTRWLCRAPPAPPLECGSPFAWHQALAQSVDDLLVAGGFAGHDGEQAFTRVNGQAQISLNQHRILRLTAVPARRSLASDG